MKRNQKTGIFAITAMVAMLSIASIAGIPESEATSAKTYEVTITNLTPGQPLSPPLLVTHNDGGFFTVGEMASSEIKQLAENGNAGPLVEMLEEDKSVLSITQGEAPLVPANDPGNTGLSYTETFEIATTRNHQYLSYASMLVCTNDGFAGIDSVKLPQKELTLYAMASDARTEMNPEDFADLVPPCQGAIGISSGEDGTGTSNPAIAEDGVIIPHVGITGKADLLEDVHEWSNPVAKIEIIRTK